MRRYLDQLSCILRPGSVSGADPALRSLAAFLIEQAPEVRLINKAGVAAGLPHIHPHQLRHTLATKAINRGMTLEAIAALLGHRSLDMTLRYVNPRELHRAGEKPQVTRSRRCRSRVSGLRATAA